MKSALVLLIFVTGLHFCFGQHQPRAFGDIPMDDLKSSSCSFDSSASAAVLFDVVSANLTTSYKYERHIRIKFFKNTSLSDWADANLVFDRTMVKLSKVKGATYNLVNGQVITTELTEQNIFETKINKRLAKVSLMLPQVLAGSIIEYTYTLSAFMDVGLSTLFGSYAGVSFIDLSWEFQRDIPVYWCEYTLTGGSGISYIQGAVALSDSSQQMKKHNTINRWTFKNVPAFQSEPSSPPKSDLIGKVYVDLYNKNWNAYGVNFGRLAKYGDTEKDSTSVRLLASRYRNISDPKAKADSVVKFVKSKMKWDKTFDVTPDRDFMTAFLSRVGSSAEINFILVALLRKAGLSSFPVAISTRGFDVVSPTRPSITPFNDIIAAVVVPKGDGKEGDLIFFDATDPQLPNDHLPLRCLNGYGLLLAQRETTLVYVTTPKSRKKVNTTIRLNNLTQMLDADVEVASHGIFASDERKAWLDQGAGKYDERLSQAYPHKSDKATISGTTNAAQPFTITFKQSQDGVFNSTADRVYIDPFGLHGKIENNFKAELRKWPIDLTPPQESTFTTKIEFPDNFSVDELPKPSAHILPGGSARFYYNVAQQANFVSVTLILIINKVIFQPNEYKALREFYSLMVAKQSETIVLKRK